MNLHSMAAQAVGSVNPHIPVTIKVSAGYTTGADGSQVPAYSLIEAIGQKQALSSQDLQKLQGLNVQGVTSKIYLNGNYDGVFRILGKGGDLIIFGGRTYLVNAVLEQWPDWVALGITLQLD
jgi:hypothetical protein